MRGIPQSLVAFTSPSFHHLLNLFKQLVQDGRPAGFGLGLAWRVGRENAQADTCSREGCCHACQQSSCAHRLQTTHTVVLHYRKHWIRLVMECDTASLSLSVECISIKQRYICTALDRRCCIMDFSTQAGSVAAWAGIVNRRTVVESLHYIKAVIADLCKHGRHAH